MGRCLALAGSVTSLRSPGTPNRSQTEEFFYVFLWFFFWVRSLLHFLACPWASGSAIQLGRSSRVSLCFLEFHRWLASLSLFDGKPHHQQVDILIYFDMRLLFAWLMNRAGCTPIVKTWFCLKVMFLFSQWVNRLAWGLYCIESWLPNQQNQETRCYDWYLAPILIDSSQ